LIYKVLRAKIRSKLNFSAFVESFDTVRASDVALVPHPSCRPSTLTSTTNLDDTDRPAIETEEMTANHDMSKLKKPTFEHLQEHKHRWLRTHLTQLEQVN
jgi:hypothetical protein